MAVWGNHHRLVGGETGGARNPGAKSAATRFQAETIRHPPSWGILYIKSLGLAVNIFVEILGFFPKRMPLLGLRVGEGDQSFPSASPIIAEPQ
jgi:hypothetical protein